MKIQSFMDLKKLQKIQDQFSDATGLAAIIIDAEGEYITKGSNFTDFCMKYTRGSAEGSKRCVKCDNECTGVYFCHAGLMDFSCPILVEGEKVGAVIGGQVLSQQPDEEKFQQIALELGISPENYIQALRKVPIRSEKTIRAAADMLGSIVNELVNLEYLKTASKRKVEVFDQESDAITEAVESVRSKMRDLDQISTMENILSINASIEAGRAGAAGVGFAVVAREMGQLAKQSAEVYKEIYTRIDEIRQSIEKMNQADL